MIGQKKVHYTEIDSTNEEAKRLLDQNDIEEGTVIIADYQTQGRGQYGRTWQSEASQNVMMSIVLSPTFLKISDQFLLNICVSLTIVKVISKYCNDVKVKWPNDIYVGDRKICGILIQNHIQGQIIKDTIIGIGLNVNQKIWPDDISGATSLALESQSNITKEDIITMICAKMDILYQELQLYPNGLKNEYLKYLYGLGEKRRFVELKNKNEEILEGTIIDIDPIGQLIIEQKGIHKSYAHGEIRQIIPLEK